MTATLDGRFMGSGPTKVLAHFRPEMDGPDFDMKVAIENIDLRTMNDMLRAHGKFDVVAGVFSFYSELAVKNAQIRGWVKPLFRDGTSSRSGGAARSDSSRSGVRTSWAPNA
jgi:hypothetical protein